tara:strand:- start:1046 stop:1171 length:126 start_codon:yes stop_codon:yes gene_type:complete
MKKIELSEEDCTYLYWLVRQEAYNQSEDKADILEIANKFKL